MRGTVAVTRVGVASAVGQTSSPPFDFQTGVEKAAGKVVKRSIMTSSAKKKRATSKWTQPSKLSVARKPVFYLPDMPSSEKLAGSMEMVMQLPCLRSTCLAKARILSEVTP